MQTGWPNHSSWEGKEAAAEGGKGIFPVLIAIICYLSVTKGRWGEREKSRMEVEEKGNGGEPPFLSSSAVLSPSLTSPPPPFSSPPLPPFFASFDFLFPGLHSAWRRGREREWVGRYYRPRYVVGLHWLAGWLGRRKSTFFSFSRSVTVSPSEEKASPSLPPSPLPGLGQRLLLRGEGRVAPASGKKKEKKCPLYPLSLSSRRTYTEQMETKGGGGDGKFVPSIFARPLRSAPSSYKFSPL